MNVESEIQKRSQSIDEFLTRHFDIYLTGTDPVPKVLLDSIQYSLYNGGKRFRPVLSLLVAEHYQQDPLQVLPWAAAIEMIHTYSLIHDDLPCMDNDDIRRGQPTNHKVYGEATALLAGDALLTEAFQMIVRHHMNEPELACRLVDKLSTAIGVTGMVGGQVFDLMMEKSHPTIDELKIMQKMKTGLLIRSALEGAAIACKASQNDVLALKFFGDSLGLAFQMTDDLLDLEEGDQGKSFVSNLGIEGTKSLLKAVSVKAKEYLNKLEKPNVILLQIVDYNLERKK